MSTKYLAHILIATVSVFAPAKAVLGATLALVLADLVTGLVAAHRRGEAITSRGLRRTILKLAIYEAAILCGFLRNYIDRMIVGGISGSMQVTVRDTDPTVTTHGTDSKQSTHKVH